MRATPGPRRGENISAETQWESLIGDNVSFRLVDDGWALLVRHELMKG